MTERESYDRGTRFSRQSITARSRITPDTPFWRAEQHVLCFVRY